MITFVMTLLLFFLIIDLLYRVEKLEDEARHKEKQVQYLLYIIEELENEVENGQIL